MWSWEGRLARRSALAFSSGVLGLFLFAGAAPSAAVPGPPTNEEYALLVFTNQARSDPSYFGFSDPKVPPLFWHDGLAAAARYHSDDTASHPGCAGHNSCDGTVWWRRIERYYPGWLGLAETFMAVSWSDPRALIGGFLGAPAHRAGLLSPGYNDFGGGLATGSDGPGFPLLTFVTNDLGYRGSKAVGSLPAIPAATVLPRIGGGEQRDLVANYYDWFGNAPTAVRALVGSSCVNLELISGSSTHGTYGAERSFQGSGCVPVVFEVIKANGDRYRWPANEAILVGVGSGGTYCAERTTAVPTQDCGGGNPLPTPTPTPTPAPASTPTPISGSPGSSELDAMKIVLKPGQANASKGRVQIQATLPGLEGFDPSSGPVTIHVGFGQSGDWTDSLAEMCGPKPCLKANHRATAYRRTWNNRNLSFVRAQDGRWKVRFSARNQTLAGLSPGPVDLTLVVSGVVFKGSIEGEMKPYGLVAK